MQGALVQAYLLLAFLVLLVMGQPTQLDHAQNVYVAVTFKQGSPLNSPPSKSLALSVSHGGPDPQPRNIAFNHAGPVGALPDVQLYGLPRTEWESLDPEGRKQALDGLSKMEGVSAVQEQVLRTRAKREEF